MSTNLVVGSKVLYRNGYGQIPIEGSVTKITKSGWIRISFPGDTSDIGPFKPSHSGSDSFVMLVANRYRHDKPEAQPWSQKLADEWLAKAEEVQNAKLEKIQAEKERRDEIDRRIAEELRDVKTICKDILPIRSKEVLPDGSRLVVLDMPLNPVYAERRKGFHVVIVRLVDETMSWRSEHPIVRGYVTEYDGRCGSFPSISGYECDSDDEALWDVVRNRYHTW